jgi:hypothetical protein
MSRVRGRITNRLSGRGYKRWRPPLILWVQSEDAQWMPRHDCSQRRSRTATLVAALAAALPILLRPIRRQGDRASSKGGALTLPPS